MAEVNKTLKIMASKLTHNGVSTTVTPRTEAYEIFISAFRPRRKRYQYDYRASNGELFSTVAPTLKECRQRRDAWLAVHKLTD